MCIQILHEPFTIFSNVLLIRFLLCFHVLRPQLKLIEPNPLIFNGQLKTTNDWTFVKSSWTRAEIKVSVKHSPASISVVVLSFRGRRTTHINDLNESQLEIRRPNKRTAVVNAGALRNWDNRHAGSSRSAICLYALCYFWNAIFLLVYEKNEWDVVTGKHYRDTCNLEDWRGYYLQIPIIQLRNTI